MKSTPSKKIVINWPLLHRLGKISVLIGVLVLLAAGRYWLFGKWLVIKNIRCIVNGQQLDQQFCLPSSNLLGKSLLFTRFDSQTVMGELQTVTAPDKLIYFSHLRKQLPDKLELHYGVSAPLYVITPDQQQWFVVNAEGKLKQVNEKPPLPVVFWSTAFASFDASSQRVPELIHSWLVEWLAVTAEENLAVSYIGLDDPNQVSLLLGNGRRILLTSQSDPLVELERLRLIEAEVAANERTNKKILTEIDLRFRFPVLREKL